MSSTWNLQPGAFAGTADAYRRYRPPYPRALLDDLLAEARPGPAPTLLDLACGPGRVTLDLARSFSRVIAIDLEPEMVGVGRAEAHQRGLLDIDWRVGRAEDIDLGEASVDLITVGEAFHRLDQTVVMQLAKRALKPGGAFATLWTSGVLIAGGPPPWKQAVADVALRWSSRGGAPAQGLPGNVLGPGSDARVLEAAGFDAVFTREFSTPHAWSVESIIGYLHSTSVCSQAALGADAAAFEAELREVLQGEGPFHEALNAGYTLGRWRRH